MNNIVHEHLDQEDFVGFWKRVLAVILDFFVLLIPATIVYWIILSFTTTQNTELLNILQYLLFLVFDIFMIVRFGGTPGKLILKIKIVNAQGNYPTLQQALIRNLFQMISLLISIVSLWAELVSYFNIILGPIMLADYLFIVFNQRKRSLHDLIAGTYVVDKSAVKGNA